MLSLEKNKSKGYIAALNFIDEPINEVEDIDELKSLAFTINIEVVDYTIQNLTKPNAATFIGKGKANDVISCALELQCDYIIFYNEIGANQIKNLQNIAKSKIKIIDRTYIILEIFTKHAKSSEAKAQVELAKLKYLLPRLNKQWTHLERQMGGIGTRGGPGEKQIEIDRRIIRNQINVLNEKLLKIQKQRKIQQSSRRNMFRVALVGYTNAGKSTIMNMLTGSNVKTKNQLFVTLDTTTRKYNAHLGQDLLISDTVGFIKNIPHDLIASFRSTLKEVESVDLLLKVFDVSSSNLDVHMETVEKVLNDLKLNKKNSIYIFNKVDLLHKNSKIYNNYLKKYSESIFISALNNNNNKIIKDSLKRFVKLDFLKVSLFISFKNYKYLDSIYNNVNVVSKKNTQKGINLIIEGKKKYISQIRKRLNS